MIAVHTLLASVVISPFLAIDVPGLGDMLNHLARMHVLATIRRSSDLQRYFEVQWAPIPYLAMDAIVPLLARLVTIYAAGKVFVLACVVSPVMGAVALHYAVHRRASLVPCSAYLLATNALLSLGFLNFLFSIGFAALLLAMWLAAQGLPRWPRALLFAPLVLLLYFGHVFAFGAYCLSVFGAELGRAIHSRFRPLTKVMADMAASFAQAVPALAFAATFHVGAGYVGRLHTVYGTVGAKLFAAVSPILLFHDRVDAAVSTGALAMFVLLARHFHLSRVILPAILLCGFVAVCVPNVLDSTWGVDLRLPLMTAILFIGGLSLRSAGFELRVLATGCVAALVAAKSADSWVVLHRVDLQIAETRRVLAHLPRGTRLLLVNGDGRGTGTETVPLSTVWHMPLVAVIDRDAFVPTLFSGLSTVHVRPQYRMSSTPNGLPITPAQLAEGDAESDVPGAERGDGAGGGRLYHFGWRQKFDYVLVQHFGGPAPHLPLGLSLTAQAPDMDLYRIARAE